MDVRRGTAYDDAVRYAVPARRIGSSSRQPPAEGSDATVIPQPPGAYLRRQLSRCRYTSAITAATMTVPVITRLVGSEAPTCASPACSTAMISTPRKLFTTEPRPPIRL